MKEKAYLILENGTIFEGLSFGDTQTSIGELVFTTAMSGYVETLTDKSYYGQMITATFPLIGNVGTMREDFEGPSIYASGYIVRHWCQTPSNFRCEGNLDTFLKEQKIPGISEIDTRELTRILRRHGTMNAMLTTNKEAIDLQRIRSYRITNAVAKVSVKEPLVLHAQGRYRIAVLDYGCKQNIIDELIKRDVTVLLLPHNTTLPQILAWNVDGILLSNGPGNPADNPEIIATIHQLMQLDIPLFGICLGHQLMALAAGFQTIKLPYGHRGANQPVKDLFTKRTYITSQNHGYAVCNEQINPKKAVLWMINANDHTCEGIRYLHKPFFSVQFHPEGKGGPQDTNHLFDEFLKEVYDYATR